MKIFTLNLWRRVRTGLLAVAVSAALALCAQETMPRIELRDVPLSSAIANLGTQAELNFVLDPRISGSPLPQHQSVPEPKVTVQWTNLTAAQAFQKLLTENRLIAITNRATSVMRIVPATAATTQTSTNNLGADTGRPIPRIGVEFMPLPDALARIAEAAQITIKVEPSVRATLEKQGPISFAWRNITPKQALTALADNYGMLLVKGSSESAFQVQLQTIR